MVKYTYRARLATEKRKTHRPPCTYYLGATKKGKGGNMKLIDLTGQRFGRLTVIERAKNSGTHTTWLCMCDCGNKHSALGCHLKSGRTKSCGCLHNEQLKDRSLIHGLSNSRLNKIYRKIKDRCYNSNYKEYSYYGGRGIMMCDKWRKDFMAFYEWAITNGYADDLTIDRIDTNGNYEPSNCRWSTKKEQANNKRNNRRLAYNGETRTIAEWSEQLGENYDSLYRRLAKNNWQLERCLKNV